MSQNPHTQVCGMFDPEKQSWLANNRKVNRSVILQRHIRYHWRWCSYSNEIWPYSLYICVQTHCMYRVGNCAWHSTVIGLKVFALIATWKFSWKPPTFLTKRMLCLKLKAIPSDFHLHCRYKFILTSCWEYPSTLYWLFSPFYIRFERLFKFC